MFWARPRIWDGKPKKPIQTVGLRKSLGALEDFEKKISTLQSRVSLGLEKDFVALLKRNVLEDFNAPLPEPSKAPLPGPSPVIAVPVA